MAAITERGGRFTARVRKLGFRPATKTFHSKRDAQAWARAVEAAMEAGRYVEPAIAKAAAAAKAAADERDARTVADAIKSYRTQRVPKMKGWRMAASFCTRLEESAIAKIRLSAVTPADVARLRDAWLAGGLKANTVGHRLSLLRAFFNWCAEPERGWLDTVPKVKKPTVRDARERVLTQDEAAAVFDAAASVSGLPWLRAAFEALYHTAMRGCELRAVRVSDVHISTSTIRLHDSKNGDARDVPLCPAALEAVQRLIQMAQQRDDGRLLPMSQTALSHAFRRAVARARKGKPEGFLADVRLHDLRHTAATRWASTGALTVFELQRITGHRDVRSLNRYVNIAPADVAKKLAAIAA